MPPLDTITLSVLIGAILGPINAWQASGAPATPWHAVSAGVKALVIGGLAGTVVAAVALVVFDRWPLAVLLVGSAALSYFLSRRRREQLARYSSS